MKHRMRSKSLLALLLCVVMIFGMMPVTAGAEDDVSTEVVSLREENIKHFDMGDGTYQAVVYSHPVHELDSQGAWQDIDFGLSLDRTNKVTTYTSKASGTAFAANYMENSTLMTLSGGEDSISMTLVVPQTAATAWTAKRTVAAKVTEADTAAKTFEEAKNAKFSNTVLYENVLPNIDLEYIADPYMVKENIIVRQPMESYTYTFQLNMDGLCPELTEEGCVLIYDTETDVQKYEMPMPYMYDALGNVCDRVRYALKELGGIYYLTVTADTEWINTEGRDFPVTIDPTVTKTITNVYDTYISSDSPNSDLGNSTELWLRSNKTTYIRTVSAFAPPSGNVLLKASLVGYYYYYDYVTAGSMVISAHQVVRGQWYEDLTWNSISNVSNFGLSADVLDTQRAYGNIGAVVNAPAKIEFNITQAARKWVSGESPNYGIGLKFVRGNISVILKSSEAETDYRPRFTYRYAPSYPVTLELCYDMGYNARYTNASIRIAQMVDDLEAFFLDEYNIDITVGGTAVFSSYADSCGTSYLDKCNHGTIDDCENSVISEDGVVSLKSLHHKNIHNIMARIDSPTLSTNVKMVFIGHRTCEYNADTLGCEDTTTRGWGSEALGVMVINNFISQESETITMIHEMGHMFGIKDHYSTYSTSATQNNSSNSQCLYGNGMYNMTSIDDIVICADCRSILEENLVNYVE